MQAIVTNNKNYSMPRGWFVTSFTTSTYRRQSHSSAASGITSSSRHALISLSVPSTLPSLSTYGIRVTSNSNLPSNAQMSCCARLDQERWFRRLCWWNCNRRRYTRPESWSINHQSPRWWWDWSGHAAPGHPGNSPVKHQAARRRPTDT